MGDVHGCLDEFRQLLDDVRFEPSDRLVLVGDLMDRGPLPVECVRAARSLGALLVQSNHDDKHLRYRRYSTRKAAHPNVAWVAPHMTGVRLEQNAALSDEDIAYLESAPDYLELPAHGFFVVHAGLIPGVAVADQDRDDLLWCRYIDVAESKRVDSMHDPETGKRIMPPGCKFWTELSDHKHHVAYGHSVHGLHFPRVDVSADGFERWGLDTGCCYGGHLSALVLDDTDPTRRTVVRVKAGRQYAKWIGTDAEAT